MVPIVCQSLLQEFLHQQSCLWQLIHAFLYLNIYPAVIFHLCCQHILLCHICWYICQFEAKVLIPFARGIEIIFFMSIIMNLAPFVKMMLFNINCMVSKADVGVPQVFCPPWQLTLSCWTLLCSVCNCRWFSHTLHPFVYSLECLVCVQRTLCLFLALSPAYPCQSAYFTAIGVLPCLLVMWVFVEVFAF